MPEERRARYRLEQPRSAAEIEKIRWKADRYLKGLFADIEYARDVAAGEWETMGCPRFRRS